MKAVGKRLTRKKGQREKRAQFRARLEIGQSSLLPQTGQSQEVLGRAGDN